MGGFCADQVFGVATNHLGAGSRFHFAGILFGRAGHAGADDVEEGENAGAGRFDNGLDEIIEILPPRSPGIDAGRHAVGE